MATLTIDVSISSSTAASVTAIAIRYLYLYLSSTSARCGATMCAEPRGPAVTPAACAMRLAASAGGLRVDVRYDRHARARRTIRAEALLDLDAHGYALHDLREVACRVVGWEQ